MPYLELKTTKALSHEKKSAIAKRVIHAFAEASDETVSGNIQLVIMDGCWIDFRKDHKNPSAYMQINPGPMTPKEDYAGIVERFFKVLTEELQIPQNRIYMTVTEITNWGFEGRLL